MTPQVPWSPTAQAFAHHQFSHVANFWKQGRQASFRLEALPGGQAKLNLTFQLPQASEVIPPPQVPPVAVTRRPAYPLFPNGSSPQNSGADPFAKNAPQKKISSRQRKSYRRSVLHKAALAAPSLPSPKSGSLRQAALASVQRQQTVPVLPVTTQSAKKRTLDSPGASSPSNLLPLAQRIRKDIQVGDFQISEGEVESPERESLRSRLDPDSFPPLNSPHSVQKVPPPAPLVFTPPKSHEGSEMPAEVAEEVFDEKVAAFEGSEEVSTFEDSVVYGEVVGKSELSKLEEVAEIAVVCDSNDGQRRHRMRWIKRLETRTDDLALRSRLIESLQAAFRTPESVLSNEDLDAVKDRFLEGALSPAQFLDELQSLLLNK